MRATGVRPESAHTRAISSHNIELRAPGPGLPTGHLRGLLRMQIQNEVPVLQRFRSRVGVGVEGLRDARAQFVSSWERARSCLVQAGNAIERSEEVRPGLTLSVEDLLSFRCELVEPS